VAGFALDSGLFVVCTKASTMSYNWLDHIWTDEVPLCLEKLIPYSKDSWEVLIPGKHLAVSVTPNSIMLFDVTDTSSISDFSAMRRPTSERSGTTSETEPSGARAPVEPSGASPYNYSQPSFEQSNPSACQPPLQRFKAQVPDVPLAGLKIFYDGAKSLLENDHAMFPFPRRAKIGGVYTEFTYTKCLGGREARTNTKCLGGREARTMVFLAKRSDNSEPIVVKFTYSEAVHRELADAGLAPALHDVQEVSGLQMVVMDYLDEARMRDSRKDRDTPSLRDQLELVLEVLKNKDFVHGDLRAPNILVAGGKILVLDFDWAGKAGEATYRKIPNPDLRWPEGATLGALITAEHDQYMIRNMLLA
jgi:hypothetical protein